MPKIANKSQFLNSLKSLANGNIVTRSQCVEAANNIGLKYPPAWFVQDKSRSAGRGLFYIDVTQRTKSVPSPTVTHTITNPMSNTNNNLSIS